MWANEKNSLFKLLLPSSFLFIRLFTKRCVYARVYSLCIHADVHIYAEYELHVQVAFRGVMCISGLLMRTIAAWIINSLAQAGGNFSR